MIINIVIVKTVYYSNLSFLQKYLLHIICLRQDWKNFFFIIVISGCCLAIFLNTFCPSNSKSLYATELKRWLYVNYVSELQSLLNIHHPNGGEGPLGEGAGGLSHDAGVAQGPGQQH